MSRATETLTLTRRVTKRPDARPFNFSGSLREYWGRPGTSGLSVYCRSADFGLADSEDELADTEERQPAYRRVYVLMECSGDPDISTGTQITVYDVDGFHLYTGDWPDSDTWIVLKGARVLEIEEHSRIDTGRESLEHARRVALDRIIARLWDVDAGTWREEEINGGDFIDEVSGWLEGVVPRRRRP